MNKKKQKGSVLLEFALCATLLITFLAGVYQFGYSFHQYNLLTNGVRAGARFASMQKISNQGNGVISDDYITAVRNVVVYGAPTYAQSDPPVVPNLKTSDITVTVNFDAKFVPKSVHVEVKAFTIDALFKKFTLTKKPFLDMPFLGQYCPIGC